VDLHMVIHWFCGWVLTTLKRQLRSWYHFPEAVGRIAGSASVAEPAM